MEKIAKLYFYCSRGFDTNELIICNVTLNVMMSYVMKNLVIHSTRVDLSLLKFFHWNHYNCYKVELFHNPNLA